MTESVKKIILLVEDESILAMTQKMQLEKYGYEVKTVNTGLKAIEALDVITDIDLVLMDINLGPGIDGTEAAEIILANHDIPIVFVSSHSEREIVEKTEKITSYGYVVKNSSITVLDASIKMAFKLFDANQALKLNLKKDHETAQLFLNVMDSFPGIIFWKDKNSIFKGCSLALARAAGLEHTKDIIGKSDYDMPWKEQDAEEFIKADRIVMDEGIAITHIIETIHTKGNSVVWLDTSKIPLFDTEGNIDGILGVSLDVTERKAEEEALRISKETSDLLLSLAAEIIMSLDEKGNITLLNDSGHAILGYVSPALVGKNWFDTCLPFEDRLGVLEYFEQLKKNKTEIIVTHEDTVITKTGDHKMIFWHNAILKDKDGRFFGIFSSGEDVTERKHAQEREKKYKERLEFALEASGLGEWEYNIKTGQMYRSKRWAEMLGYSKTEIEDNFNQCVELQHPDDREMVSNVVKDYYEGRIDNFKVDYRMRTKNGVYKWIQDCGKIVERNKDGDPVRSCGTHADIDDQKKGQILLEKEQKRLQNFLHGMNAGTWDWNVQTGEAEIDTYSAALLGYTLDELRPDIFQSWMNLKHPDDLAESNELLMKHVRSETDSYSFESRMKHKDGAWIWIQGFGKLAEWDANGNPLRIFGTHIDITERKQNEIALAESQERLQFALEGSGLGEWDWDLRTNKIKRNDRWAQILGYTLAEIGDDLTQGIDLEHPDDREASWKEIQNHLNGKSDYYDNTYRMRAKDGRYRWIHDCGKIMERDKFGKPVRLCGTHADITDQKEKEDKIKLLLAEKELILKEVHHRIKNNMTTISSLLSLQAGNMTDPSAVAVLEDAENRIRSMSLLYEKLYRSTDFIELSVKEYLSSLIDEVIENNNNNDNIIIKKDLQEFMMDAEHLQPLGIIVNELLTNTTKYAFGDRKSGMVKVTSTNTNNHICISVQDDGIGIPKSVSFESSNGFGLQLVKALTEQLHGSVRIERGSGTKIVLEFEV